MAAAGFGLPGGNAGRIPSFPTGRPGRDGREALAPFPFPSREREERGVDGGMASWV